MRKLEPFQHDKSSVPYSGKEGVFAVLVGANGRKIVVREPQYE
jgi:hypothetical protein